MSGSTRHKSLTYLATIGLVGGLLSGCHPTPAASAASPPAAESFPLVAGNGASPEAFQIAASLGRGLNLGNILEAPREGDWGRPLQDADIERIRAAGFKTIRLPVRFSNHAALTAPYTIDPAFFARVDHVVDVALAAGLDVILDLHHYHQLNGEPLDPHEDAVAAADVEPRFVALWSQIALHFQGRPQQLLFEVMNEPNHDLVGQRWNRLAAQAVAAIRATEKTRIVVVGPDHWNAAQALGDFVVPNDSNLIVTVHNYEPFFFTHQGATWIHPTPPLGTLCCDEKQITTLIGPLEIAHQWGEAHHYPIYLGEFGSDDHGDLRSRMAFTRIMRDAAEQRGMSWAYWEYNAGFGVYNPQTGEWNRGLLAALLSDKPQP